MSFSIRDVFFGACIIDVLINSLSSGDCICDLVHDIVCFVVLLRTLYVVYRLTQNSVLYFVQK